MTLAHPVTGNNIASSVGKVSTPRMDNAKVIATVALSLTRIRMYASPAHQLAPTVMDSTSTNASLAKIHRWS